MTKAKIDKQDNLIILINEENGKMIYETPSAYYMKRYIMEHEELEKTQELLHKLHLKYWNNK